MIYFIWPILTQGATWDPNNLPESNLAIIWGDAIVKGIEIKQSTTTTITIPVPGIVTLLMTNPGYCSIYVQRGPELEWVYNVGPDVKNETVVLQPGSYRIVFRPRYAKSSYYTIEKRINVKSGSSQSLKL